ncbi:ECF RNA polymerase sigma factor SigW [Ktedonobacter sp. SOSP1-85]|uniref:RNA polymerase sigma factor n=1 Tax=Ktedonobacter sp. SOSP1-85 TaxID=2778367 RepID=UPI001916140E|nr:sigma-70 family RNA polymerase sigma factor [Ktedonobacter sp. SOSP1-85]GHO76676.1 ECF RNA polymerase sigma factor SigW [Ktedonobacter sp. SOSP1-85]
MKPAGENLLALFADDVERYYEELVVLYWHQLCAFVYRRVGSMQDAEDIVQEAFLRAYMALETYSPERIQMLKARAWLYKITWNVYCNYTGRVKAPPSIYLDTSDESPHLAREDELNAQPERAFELAESRQELELLVALLPAHYRDVVSLYFFEDLTYQEIADVLEQPLGTVKVYVHRGVKLLRKTFEEARPGIPTGSAEPVKKVTKSKNEGKPKKASQWSLMPTDHN